MKKKRVILLILFMFFAVWLYLFITPRKNSTHTEVTQNQYFYPVAIQKFTKANQPCVPIEIEGQTITAMLDLGFRGQFAFSAEFLNQLQNKKYLHSQKMYSILGQEYNERVFKIPTITMGSMTFSEAVTHEQPPSFHADITLVKEDNTISTPETGKIGWELFGNTNIFLDLKNEKIAFCDSLTTIREQGYDQTRFIKIPLQLKRGLVEIELTTSKGPLRCMLDTGSTWNIINTDLKENQSIQEAARAPQNTITLTTQELEEAITFHCLPIKLPIHIDAILGMEFLEEKLIFLDFSKNHAYFSSLQAN